MFLCECEVLALMVDCRHRFSVIGHDHPAVGLVMRHGLDGINRIGECETVWNPPLFNQSNNKCGGADFESCCVFRHICIACDAVESPEFRCVCMRFVARIDDRSIVHGINTCLNVKEISSLG